MTTMTMDPETAKLAVSLQLAEINSLLDSITRGFPIERDEETGLQILKADLERQLTMLESQVLAVHILKKEHADRVALARLVREEKQAFADHELAMHLAGMPVHQVRRTNAERMATLKDESDVEDDEQLGKAMRADAWSLPVEPKDLFVLIQESNNKRSAEESVPERPKKKSTFGDGELLECVACLEKTAEENTLTLACEQLPHTYCHACLFDLSQSSLVDMQLFPPRCCKVPIPLEMCRAILPKELVKDFDLRLEELTMPSPTYCHEPACAKFIQAKNIRATTARCAFCGSNTCVACKRKDHDDLCPEDPHVKLLMQAAERSKWQQCAKCKNLVELNTGCFHMT